MTSSKLTDAPATRRERKDATRRGLLDAAGRCFAARGYDETVVADIVREAGVAHGTFYVHFQDKAAAADAILAEWNAALAARLARVLAGAAEGPTEPVVRRAAGVFLEALAADRPFVAWYARRAAAGLSVEALRDGVNPPAVALLAGVLASRIRDRAAAARAELAVQGILALWLRVGLRFALGRDVPRRRAEDVLTTMTVGALDALLAPRRSGKEAP